MCTTVFAWITPSLMDCRVWQVAGYRFWGGPIALQGFVQISDKKNSCNTKVVFNHFDRGSNDLKCLLEGKHVLIPCILWLWECVPSLAAIPRRPQGGINCDAAPGHRSSVLSSYGVDMAMGQNQMLR